VTLPIEQFHAPAGLSAGDVVDIYATPSDATIGTNAAVIAQSVVVHQVDTDGGRFGSASGSTGVVVEVPTNRAARIVAGVRSGSVDLVPVVWGRA
jgi:ribosomal protein L2